MDECLRILLSLPCTSARSRLRRAGKKFIQPLDLAAPCSALNCSRQRLLSKSLIVCVSMFSAAVESRPVVGVKRLAFPDSSHEIRICDEETTKANAVRMVLFNGEGGALRAVSGCGEKRSMKHLSKERSIVHGVFVEFVS